MNLADRVAESAVNTTPTYLYTYAAQQNTCSCLWYRQTEAVNKFLVTTFDHSD